VAGNPTLDELADELYTLPPEQFVATRDERSRAARSAGDRGLASQLAGLRRPTTSAWVLNLLVRDQPGLLDQLLELGAELVRAQRELRGSQLRELAGQRQRVVAELVRAARRRAAEAGHPASAETGYEVEQTLHAALADPAVARQVCSGRLVRPVTVSGFGVEPATPPSGTATAGEPGAAADGAPTGAGDGAPEAAGDTREDPADDGRTGGERGQRGAQPPDRPQPDAAQRRQQERARAEEERADREAARRQAERGRLQATRDAAQADLEGAEVDLLDAAHRLAAAEQARTDAADLVLRLEEQLNTARRAQRESGSQLRDAQRRHEAATRGRDGAARRLAEASTRLDAHRG
jgi:hypothetical protein